MAEAKKAKNNRGTIVYSPKYGHRLKLEDILRREIREKKGRAEDYERMAVRDFKLAKEERAKDIAWHAVDLLRNRVIT